MSWLDNLIKGYQLSNAEQVIVGIALSLLSAGFTFIVILFTSRIIKSNSQNKEKKIRSRIQKILNALVINETFSTNGKYDSVFEYRMAELRSVLKSSDFTRQVLIDQILEFKKNLTGGAVHVLTATYFALELERLSLKKLKRSAWRKKALGLRELSEMNFKAAIPLISEFIHSSNQTLREESVMALVRFNTEKSLQFLDNYAGDITPWMQINIHHYLQKSDLRKIPQFKQWFSSSNVSVVLFSMNMAKHFRQSSAIPDLLPLCNHPNQKVAEEAIETLGELEAFEERSQLVKLTPMYWDDAALSIKILQCLGKIGDPFDDTHIILEFLNHEAYDVRFEAVKTLKKLGLTDQHILANTQMKGMSGIIDHTAEPLLQ